MINTINFEDIMVEVTARNKLKLGDTEVDIVYEVFKNTNKFVSTYIHRYCSKTASDVACWISDTMKPSQTSIEIKVRDLVSSDICNSKHPDSIRKAIKELVDVGAIIRWKDIEDLPSNVKVTKDWYLLNPQMIKAISCKAFKEQVNTSMKSIRNSKEYQINEYSAIVYNFKNNNNESIK